jgi:dihydrofolate reductase
VAQPVSTKDDGAFARKMIDTPKIVFSKTLSAIRPGLPPGTWKNTSVAKGELVEEVTRLKKQPGKEIIAYGGATFASDLIKHGLIDDYHLFVNPSAIGRGMPIFKGLETNLKLNLISARSFGCGIVSLHYKPK